MTMAEKILSRASGKTEVKAGDYLTAKVDMMMLYDTFPHVYQAIKEAGIENEYKIAYPDKLALGIDHTGPALDKNVDAAESHKEYRELVNKLGIRNFYDCTHGIMHQVMVEKGHVRPGELVLAEDSHSTIYGGLNAGGTGIGMVEMVWLLNTGSLWFKVPETLKINVTGKLKPRVMAKDLFLHVAGKYGPEVAQYKSIEWVGPAAKAMSVDGRLCVGVQSVELGAKFGLFEADEKTAAYVKKRTKKPFKPVASDRDATFEKEFDINGNDIVPLVAVPHGFEVVKPASELTDVKVDQALIGSCASGRLEDIQIAAKLLKGRHVAPGVRFMIGPASWEVYLEASELGLLTDLVRGGALVVHPGCGVCTGVIGALAEGETCITCTTRNFRGRMGSIGAKIYLGSPATVTASAIKGHIVDPRELK